jgi:hypothetical protein
MASDPSGARRDAINPYAASHVAESEETRLPPVPRARDYRLHMDWADRRRFLRSVGLLRIAAVAGAMMGFYGLYGLLNSAYSSWRVGTLAIWFEPLMAARWSFVLLKAALAFYTCWLQWTLADALAATAGGTSGKMDHWSVLQLRIAWVAVVVVAVGALSLAWEWLAIQFVVTSSFGV